MKVKSIMQRDVAACGADDPMHVAANLMWDRDCGFVPVVERETGRLAGAVTDRDLCMAALLSGRSHAELAVRDAMAPVVHSCHPGDDIREAHALMREKGVRRLPVVDDEERLVGVLSLSDLALEAFGGRGEARVRRQRDVGKSFAAVSKRRE